MHRDLIEAGELIGRAFDATEGLHSVCSPLRRQSKDGKPATVVTNRLQRKITMDR